MSARLTASPPARAVVRTLALTSVIAAALGWLAVRPHAELAPLRSTAFELDEPWGEAVAGPTTP